IDIAKGGNAFAHHGYIVTAATPIFAHLAREKHLAGLGPPAFSARAAHYVGEVNALHPFREGNGRAQREFFSHLAHAAGYYVAWENMAPPALLKASIESFQGDVSNLGALIHENLSPIDRSHA
ncbi:MAG: Fic family protein, partial [Polyangiaceae bacterium]|nr:Fic family protein [Polyangiaceae bacterium]